MGATKVRAGIFAMDRAWGGGVVAVSQHYSERRRVVPRILFTKYEYAHQKMKSLRLNRPIDIQRRISA